MRQIFLTMNFLTKALASLVLLAGLQACGGGQNAGTPLLGSGVAGAAASGSLLDLALTADKASLPNSGEEVLTLTVTAIGAGNAALTGVATPVTLEVDAGALVTLSSNLTNLADGKLSATISLIDKTSRTVNVTARSGTLVRSLTFKVLDSITGSALADLSVVVDKSTLPNTGAEQSSITVTALDAARSALGGIAVNLQLIDSGDAIILDPTKTMTDALTGQLTRRLSLQNIKSNRTISVKAISGTVSRTVTIDVIDPPAGTVLTASDLSLALSKSSIGNSGGETVSVTAKAVDANRNVVAGIDVLFKVSNNAILTPINTKTDAKGEAKATVEIGTDRSNRIVQVSAQSQGLLRVAPLEVTGARLQATVTPASRLAGQAGQVAYALLDINGSPMAAAAISAAGPGTASGSGSTDAQGRWTYQYIAEGAGSMPINASAGGVSTRSYVNVGAQPGPLPVGTVILSATMTLDPLVIKVNQVGSDANRAEIRLLFRGLKNAPIENLRVRVGLASNSSIDGRLSVNESDPPLLSDQNGVVALSFIAGERASPTGGVKISACYGLADNLGTSADGCSNGFSSNQVAVTVVESPISISIGSDDSIALGDTGLTYVSKFSLLVVDAAGNPKSDVQVTPMIDLLGYAKGQWLFSSIDKKWVIPLDLVTGQPIFLKCPNEDRLDPDGSRNGAIEAGEDINGNLQLDPRKSDVSISMSGSTRTDSNGLAILRIEYPKSVATWVRYSIHVSAPGVISPPAWYGRYEERWLSAPVSVFKSEGEPAFRVSPYGLDSTGTPGSTDTAALGSGCYSKN